MLGYVCVKVYRCVCLLGIRMCWGMQVFVLGLYTGICVGVYRYVCLLGIRMCWGKQVYVLMFAQVS